MHLNHFNPRTPERHATVSHHLNRVFALHRGIIQTRNPKSGELSFARLEDIAFGFNSGHCADFHDKNHKVVLSIPFAEVVVPPPEVIHGKTAEDEAERRRHYDLACDVANFAVEVVASALISGEMTWVPGEELPAVQQATAMLKHYTAK